MTEAFRREAQASSNHRSSRSDPSLRDHSRLWRVFVLVIAPALFGIIAGSTLKWSATAWSVLQTAGVISAILGGLDHKRWWSAAARGALAGLIAAVVIICVDAAIPGANVKAFGPSYVPIAVIISAVLHTVGGLVVRRILLRLRRKKLAESVPAQSYPQVSNR
ncbi:hypothetical protein [Streptomyces hygroscopicus]|uniref:hypothetical protein n=1 Tax=Streptomyces hygroscopicus TaxID=1912 RepID=UPI0037B0C769